MKQEDKELLLKDLCGRLPYGVKFRYKFINNFFHEDYTIDMLKGVIPPYHIIHSTLVGEDYLQIEEDEVKPYLFPLSSMTDEQEEEYNKLNCYEGWFPRTEEALDYLIANHFDYRGLIHMGLAIDATGLNIY